MAAGDPTPPDLGGVPVDRDKLTTIGIRATDRTGQTRATTDELGNTLTHHWSDDARQDVTVIARPVRAGLKLQES